jgi:hypothetical protein
VALEEYDSGQRDLRRIVRAIHDRVDAGWCNSGEDAGNVVAYWILHKRVTDRNGHQLVASRQA